VVAGDGPEREQLNRLAEDNIEFVGYVSEKKKQELLSGAKAFVFNGQNEDFGISPVEALAAGTPLLGVEEGMTQHQVFDGKNGYTFEREESGATIREAIRRFERNGVAWSDEDIAASVERFSVTTFHRRIKTTIERAIERADITPEWKKGSDQVNPASDSEH
jgi:glycosyltransferase involved in cell wall biosynthesis